MRKFALSLAAALLTAGTAQAALVTVEYSLPVAWIAEESLDPYYYQIVDSTFMPGFYTYRGDPISGRFTYDDAAPLQPTGNGYGTPLLSHTLTFFYSETTVTLDNAALNIWSSSSADGLNVSSGGYIEGTNDPYFNVEFSFTAPAGTHIPGRLPTAADWQSYAANTANPFRMSIHATGYNVYLTGGDMWVQVSSVPEPATCGMLAAGLGLVGLAARRRKARAA